MGNTALDMATWMVEEIKEMGNLQQEDAIAYVRKHFGEAHVFVNENNHASLSKEVKKAFRKLHGGRIAWDRNHFFWSWT